MRKILLTAAILAFAAPLPAFADEAQQCKGSPKVVDDCMVFYGRLNVYGGNPSLRLWPVGTKQFYGIVGTGSNPEQITLPPKLNDALAANPLEINGKWEVCPLEPQRPNRLRKVCLESATELRPVPRN